MSLMDAMLLEGYRDPKEVYIALRTDGLKGSGTIDDPYDGGTRLGVPLSGSLSCDLSEILIESASPFTGLVVGTQLTFLNVNGPAAAWFNSSTFIVVEILETAVFEFNSSAQKPFRCLVRHNGTPAQVPAAPPSPPYSWLGSYRITYSGLSNPVIVSARWPLAKVTTTSAHGLGQFAAVRVSGISNASFAGDYSAFVSSASGQASALRFRLSFLPDATQLAALPLSCSVTPIMHRFDEVMRTVPPYSIVHLGPAAFETRGYCGVYFSNPLNYLSVYVGFPMRAGHCLWGSGIGATTLKLVLPEDQINQVTAIGGPSYPLSHYAQVSDLTVDCGGPAHVAPYGLFPAPYTCGAVALQGSHIHIRRARAINFCTQGPAECFPFFISQLHHEEPTGAYCVIEDCITEKPGENNTHETTLISIVGDGVRTSALSPVVRHNFQNSDYSNGFSPQPVPLAALQRDGTDTTLAILTTSRSHTHVKGKALVVQGAKLGGVVSSIYNGIFTIEEIVSDTVLKYRLTSNPGTGAVDISGASIGWPISSEAVAVAGLSVDAAGTATLATKRPHNRLPGQNILLEGVVTGNGSRQFFGTFKITGVISSTQLQFFSGTFSSSIGVTGARIGPAFMGRGALSGTGCVTEGNAVFNSRYGCYQDTGSTQDVVMRDNYYSNVNDGLDFDFNPIGGGVSDPSYAKRLTYSVNANGKYVAEFELEDEMLNLGIEKDYVVTVAGVLVSGDLDNPYNGTFDVTAVTGDRRKFSYEMKSNPQVNADFPTQGYFQSRWQVRHLVFENNVCEIAAFNSSSALLYPRGFQTFATAPTLNDPLAAGPPYMFPQALVRGNQVRYNDEASVEIPSNGAFNFSVRALCFENTLVEGNLFDLIDPHTMHYGGSRNFSAFNNLTSAGVLVALYEDLDRAAAGPWKKKDGVEDHIHDALTMSLL